MGLLLVDVVLTFELRIFGFDDKIGDFDVSTGGAGGGAEGLKLIF